MPRHAAVLASPVTGAGLLRWTVATQRWPLLLGMAAGVGWMGALAAVPAVLGAVLDRGVASGQWPMLAAWLGVLVGVGAAGSLAGVVRHWFAVRLYADTRRLLVEQVCERALATEGGLDAYLSAGELVSHVDRDAERIGVAIDVACRGTGAVVTFVAVAVALLAISPPLGAVVAGGLPPLLLVMVPLWRPLERRARTEQETLTAAAGLAADTVVGLRVLKGLGGEAAVKRRFAARADAVRDAAIGVARLDAGWGTLRVAVPALFLFAVVWIGGGLVAEGRLSVGQLVAAFGYAAFLVTPVATFGEVGRKWAQAWASADRIAALLDTPSAVTRPSAPPAQAGADDHLELEAVGVWQQGRWLLDGVDLSVAGGQLVAVACADRATTAALCELLGGHADPDRGGLRLAGIDLTCLPLGWLRRRVLVAEHEAFLFAGTLRSNLALDRDEHTDPLGAVLHTAAAEDVVSALPGGLDGPITARGRSLSGGQRQRMALARALLADPDVLVLDDPTCAVDAHTEQAIVDRLRRARAGRTTLVLTTSPVVLSAADQVALLVEGRLAAAGTHHQLLVESAAYRALVTPSSAHEVGR